MRHTTLILLLLLVASLFAQESSSDTLKDYQNMAIKNNPSVAYSDAGVQISKQKLNYSNSWADPVISGGWALDPVATKNGELIGKLGIQQMLPAWRMPTLKKRASSYQVESATNISRDVALKLRKSVALKYYQLYLYKTKLKLLEKQIINIELLNAQNVVGLENDVNPLTDVLDWQIKSLKLQKMYDNLFDKQASGIVDFNLVLGREVMTEVVLPENLTLPNLSAIDVYNPDRLNKHPILQALDARIEASEIATTIERRNKLPRLGVGVEYSFINDDGVGANSGKDAVMASMSLSIPWQRKALNSKVKESELKVQQARLEHEKIYLSLQQSYSKLKADLGIAIRNYQTTIEISKLLNQSLKLVSAAFENGESQFKEVLLTENKVYQNELARFEAIVEYYQIVAELDYLISGGMNE